MKTTKKRSSFYIIKTLVLAFAISFATYSLYAQEENPPSNPPSIIQIENLEIPACPSGSLFISESNIDEILSTPEKEDSHQIISHNGFILCYREFYEQPEWVCYTLDKNKTQKNVKRNDKFRSDPQVATGSASLDDYKKSGFDRGHLAPAADLTYSKETMSDSFFLSNMSPQRADFNRGIWKDLESELRTQTENFDVLYIVTGPVLEKKDYETTGVNSVAVPEFFYKAILAVKDGKYHAIGFILPNQKCTDSFWNYAVPVDEIEKRTGIDFFYRLDDTLEAELESQFFLSDWKRDEPEKDISEQSDTQPDRQNSL
ncbi:MAG: DNA/RNA non-specific endonuclease [Treponema sp.]